MGERGRGRVGGGEKGGGGGRSGVWGGEKGGEGLDGYKQGRGGAGLVAQRDVILMMDRGGGHAAGDDIILGHPALGQTPAAQTGAIVRQSGLLMLGFGPRTPEAVSALRTAHAEVLT